MMDTEETEAVAAICLMAALADGSKSDPERRTLRDLYDSLGAFGEASLYKRVMLKQTNVQQEAARIHTPGIREYVYEMAVGVCDADGVASEAERAFLDQLRDVLGLDAQTTQNVLAEANAIVTDEPPTVATSATLPVAAALPAATAAPAAAGPSPEDSARDAEVDKMVLNYSILNGALELLPQSLATLAILPLQTKMVYRIGQKYGYSLDASSAKEFLATIGVGISGQVVENYVRGIFGKLMKKAGGKMAGKIGAVAAGSAMSFGTTYGIGFIAKKYYSSGRTLSLSGLKGEFANVSEKGKALYDQYRPQVEAKAATLDTASILNMVKGQGPV